MVKSAALYCASWPVCDILRIEEIDRYAKPPQAGVMPAHVVAVVVDDIAVASLEESGMLSSLTSRATWARGGCELREESAVALDRPANAADGSHALGGIAAGIEQAKAVALLSRSARPDDSKS